MPESDDATYIQERIADRAYQAISRWTQTESGFGRIGRGGTWVLSNGNIYVPDVWWCREPPTGERHEEPPDLAVTVRSPGDWAHELMPERSHYTRPGVGELWYVDSPVRAVLVVRPGDEREVGPGELLTSPLLPGFAVAVNTLFDLGDA